MWGELSLMENTFTYRLFHSSLITGRLWRLVWKQPSDQNAARFSYRHLRCIWNIFCFHLTVIHGHCHGNDSLQCIVYGERGDNCVCESWGWAGFALQTKLFAIIHLICSVASQIIASLQEWYITCSSQKNANFRSLKLINNVIKPAATVASSQIVEPSGLSLYIYIYFIIYIF